MPSRSLNTNGFSWAYAYNFIPSANPRVPPAYTAPAPPDTTGRCCDNLLAGKAEGPATLKGVRCVEHAPFGVVPGAESKRTAT